MTGAGVRVRNTSLGLGWWWWHDHVCTSNVPHVQLDAIVVQRLDVEALSCVIRTSKADGE